MDARVRRLWRKGLPLAVVVGALSLTPACGRTPPEARPISRFEIAVPEGTVFTSTGRHTIALAPDGTTLIFNARSLHLRRVADAADTVIHGTEGIVAIEPVFSPDGQSIAFFSVQDRAIMRIPVSGGTAVAVCPAINPHGMTWDHVGVLFAQNAAQAGTPGGRGIFRVAADGGTPELVIAVAEHTQAHGPLLLPGDEWIMFTLATGTSAPDRWETADIVVQSLKSGVRKRLITGGADAKYMSTSGHIIFARGGRLLAVPLDLERMEVLSEPVVVVDGVRRASNAATGAAQYALSPNGTLAYVPGPVSSVETTVVLADRSGQVEPLGLPAANYQVPRVSPDGTRIAFVVEGDKETFVGTSPLTGAGAVRRVTSGGHNRAPVWSGDGTRIAFQSDRDGDRAIFWQAADGTGVAERLTRPEPGEAHEPETWLPNGDQFLFHSRKGSDITLWMYSLATRTAQPFGDVRSSGVVPGAVFSPDGTWVTYATSDGASTTLSVQPYPSTGARYDLVALAADSPHAPTWSPDGTELFYHPRGGGFSVVGVVTVPTFAFRRVDEVPRSFVLGGPVERRAYDITPGGKFIGVVTANTAQMAGVAAPIQVVVNWFEELKRLVPRVPTTGATR